MKKMSFRMCVLALVMTVLAVFYACESTTNEPPKTYTTEESKDKLDESLASVVSAMSDLENIEITELAKNMSVMNIILPHWEQDLLNPSTNAALQEAIEQGILTLTLSELTNWGSYTYNFEKTNYEFTEGETGTFVINTPSSDEATSNDVEIKLTLEFKDLNIVKDIPYEGNSIQLTLEKLFTDIDFSIKQNNEQLASYSFSQTLNDDGLPLTAETVLTLDAYEIIANADASDRSKNMTQSMFLGKAGKELVGYTLILETDLSNEKIETIINEAIKMNESGELPDDDFLSSLNHVIIAEIRFDAFVINGVMDGEKIYEAYKGYDGDEHEPSEADMQYIIEEINKASVLNLKHQDGAAVGAVEAYLTEDGEPSLRFKFNDGTYMSPEDQNINSQLEELFNDFLRAIAELEAAFEE